MNMYDFLYAMENAGYDDFDSFLEKNPNEMLNYYLNNFPFSQEKFDFVSNNKNELLKEIEKRFSTLRTKKEIEKKFIKAFEELVDKLEEEYPDWNIYYGETAGHYLEAFEDIQIIKKENK